MSQYSLSEQDLLNKQPSLTDTIPNTPEPFSIPGGSFQPFARLTPINAKARSAFDYAVDAIKHNPDLFEYARRNMCIESARQESVSVASVFTDSEDTKSETSSNGLPHRYRGYFRLDLSNPPINSRAGWVLGDGRGSAAGHVDFLLSGPKKVADIAGMHAMIFPHKQTCRLVLGVRHKTVLLASDGSRTSVSLSRSSACAVQELAWEDEIRIGDCAYLFTYEDHATGEEHQHQLEKFMKECHGVGWEGLQRLLGPSPDAMPIRLHKYSWTLGAFAKGTFGQVAAGTGSEGNAVAVKRIYNPVEAELSAHRKMMAYLGRHPNIVELLDCYAGPDAAIPEAYCIYQPLACGSLMEIADQKKLSIAIQVTLFRQYLNGLSFLHDGKGVMHRDIKPANLGVVALNPPVGVIFDLDAASREETSTDHKKGTLSFLAPEIVALKNWDIGKRDRDSPPPPYGRNIDIWALGISAHSVYTGKVAPNKCISMDVYQAIRGDLECEPGVDDGTEASYRKIVREMLTWITCDRPSAAEALEEIRKIDRDSSEEGGAPVERPSGKRPQQGHSSASGYNESVRRKK